MGYFNELPDILYQSPLSHKKSSVDYVAIKNIFRRTKLFDYLSDNVSFFNKYIIEDGDRPDTVAENLYGNSELDYIVVLMAGITNITHEWPVQDFQIYNFALAKYGSEVKMNEIKYYETLEIVDDQNRQIVPPKLIVDADFKVDGTINKFPSSTRYTLKSLTGDRQLDDKDEFTVATDNIARAVTNLEYEYTINEGKREINVLAPAYIQLFINDLRDIVRYDKSSNYISPNIAGTENTNVVNP